MGISITDKKIYQYTRRLNWTMKALADQLTLLKKTLQPIENSHETMLVLQAIYDNIKGFDLLLKSLSSTG